MKRTAFDGVVVTASLVALCGCGAHTSKSAHPADVLRDAITPVATTAPEGVLAPTKYVPPRAPTGAVSPGGIAGQDPAAADTVGLPRFGDFVNVEKLPEAVTRVTPHYPDVAREAGIDGTVMVQALVGRNGNVYDVRVVKSIPALDEAAKASVRQWKFTPALWKGKPVAVWIGVPVKFSLH